MLSFECANPLWGISRNPYAPSQIPGGSSGGEAALLASDGSACGVGSDIGGSLRIPAHFSGCFGLKPSGGRWPGGGTRSPQPGFTSINSTRARRASVVVLTAQSGRWGARSTILSS